MWFTECHSWELAFSFKLGSPSLRLWTNCTDWYPSCHQYVPASDFGQASLTDIPRHQYVPAADSGQASLTDIPHVISMSQPQILDKLHWLISLMSSVSPRASDFGQTKFRLNPSCHQYVPATDFGQTVLTDIPHIIIKSQPQILDKLYWLISHMSSVSPSFRFWTSCSDWYPSCHQ
jgi:hypothetical protein